MKTLEIYEDLKGNVFYLDQLDAEERKLIRRFLRRAGTHPDWCDFGNYWMREVAKFYDERGLSRPETRRTAAYRIGQDLAGRIGIASGYIRPPSYRGELEGLISKKYKSRREFCKAAGISEDMLSHVLAGRKDLSIGALEEALSRIGYRLKIMPAAETKKVG